MKNTCLKCNHRLLTEVPYCPYCGQSQEVVEENPVVTETSVVENSVPVAVPEVPSSPEPVTSSASDPIAADVPSAEVSPTSLKTTQEPAVVTQSKPAAPITRPTSATSGGFGKFFLILSLVIIVLVGAIVAILWFSPSDKDQQPSSVVPGTSSPPVVIPTLPSAPDPVVDPLAKQVDALLVKARAALKANQFDKAQAFAESALALNPKSVETKRFIEQIKRDRQQFLKDGTSIE